MQQYLLYVPRLADTFFMMGMLPGMREVWNICLSLDIHFRERGFF